MLDICLADTEAEIIDRFYLRNIVGKDLAGCNGLTRYRF